MSAPASPASSRAQVGGSPAGQAAGGAVSGAGQAAAGVRQWRGPDRRERGQPDRPGRRWHACRAPDRPSAAWSKSASAERPLDEPQAHRLQLLVVLHRAVMAARDRDQAARGGRTAWRARASARPVPARRPRRGGSAPASRSDATVSWRSAAAEQLRSARRHRRRSRAFPPRSPVAVPAASPGRSRRRPGRRRPAADDRAKQPPMLEPRSAIGAPGSPIRDRSRSAIATMSSIARPSITPCARAVAALVERDRRKARGHQQARAIVVVALLAGARAVQDHDAAAGRRVPLREATASRRGRRGRRSRAGTTGVIVRERGTAAIMA